MLLPIMTASLLVSLVTLRRILPNETDIKPSAKARSIDRARGVRAKTGRESRKVWGFGEFHQNP